MSKFPVLSISLFSTESGQTSNRKVPCFTNKVLEWYKHVFQIHNFPWWQNQNYSSANYIHCSTKLSVTVHNSHPKLLSLSVLAQRLSFRFFLEDHHLSKIRLGANVMLRKWYLASFCCRSHSPNNSYPSKCSSELNPNPTSICTHTIHLFQLWCCLISPKYICHIE